MENDTIALETMRTKRFQLRKFTPTDIGNVFRGLSHPGVIRYYGISFLTLEATQEQMDWFAQIEKDGTGMWFAICSPDNSIFYGAGGFSSRNAEFGKAEIGFWLLPEYWGMGIMTEVFPVLCGYGFNELELHRIEGFVESGNTACKNAMKKLHFTYEGTMRECEIKDGKHIDLEIYAKLKYPD